MCLDSILQTLVLAKMCSTGQSVFEPHRKKTSLRDFRPGQTQTGLYINRRWLKAGNFGFRKKRDVMKTKVLISGAVTAQPICDFVFAYAKIRFSHNAAHIIAVQASLCLSR